MALFQNLLSSISFNHSLNLLLFLVFLYIADFYYKYFNRVNKLPGPFPLPIIGSLWNKRDRYNEWILKLQRQYGDIFEVWLGPTRKIYLCRAEYFDKIHSLNTKSKWLSRMRATEGTFELGMGQRGVWLNANVEDWKYNRHFFNQVMLAPGFNLKAVNATNKMLKDMEQYWTMLGKDHPIDLCKWMGRFTIEMVSVITTGKRSYSLPAYFNTLSTKKADILSSILEDSEYLIKNFEKFFSSLPIFTIFPYYIRHYFPILRNLTKIGLESRDNLHNIFLGIIRERRKELEKNDCEVSNDMLTSLIMANTKKNHDKDVNYDLRPMTDHEIMGNILDAFLGGGGPSTFAVCVITHYMCKYPKVLQKVRQELDSVFGNDCNHPFTLDDLSKLKYCEAVINETIRVHNAAHTVPRENTGSDELLGYNWPAHSEFMLFYEGGNKHPDFWKNPEDYDPDRFMKEDMVLKRNFVIFGGGLRQCPGKKLALIWIKGFMATFLRKYDITLMYDELNFKSTLFKSYLETMNIKISPRNNATLYS